MKNFLWEEKYRPKSLEECIFPERLKETFQGYINQGAMPNLLLSGSPGIGKTTVARALCNDMQANFMEKNASLDRSIDLLRTEIFEYASTVSFLGGRKYVILDEADNLSADTFQPALRAFMQEFSANCGFILTCNWPSKIIEPLRSRLTEIDFGVAENDWKELAPKIGKNIHRILTAEGVEIDTKVLLPFLKKFYPDMRKMLVVAQSYAAKTGRFDSGILTSINSSYEKLIGQIRNKDFKGATETVLSSNSYFGAEFYTSIFDARHEFVEDKSIPELIVNLAEFQYKEAFCANKQINTLALLAILMTSLAFK